MSVINKSALVSYSASEMYALVNDVSRYSEFLPWCSDSAAVDENSDEMRARLDLALGGMRKTFTTHNRLQKNKMIEIRLIDGPFKRLQGYWRFDPLDDQACKVTLDLEYEFSSKMLALALGPLFHQVTNTLVDAFCKRAVEIYGKR